MPTKKRPVKKSSPAKRRPPRQKWALWLLGIVIIVLAFAFLYPKPAVAPIEILQPVLIGTYSGTLPCADCSGIDATLTLASDGTYSQTYVYQGKDTNFTEKGTYTVNRGTPENAQAELLTLLPEDNGQPQFLMATNSSTLQILGADKTVIEGTPLPMVLQRAEN